MNAIELRDYYRSRQEAHELLAAQAGENYIAKIHLDLAARYAALVGDGPRDERLSSDEPQSDPVNEQCLEDSLSSA